MKHYHVQVLLNYQESNDFKTFFKLSLGCVSQCDPEKPAFRQNALKIILYSEKVRGLSNCKDMKTPGFMSVSTLSKIPPTISSCQQL